jgi:N-acetylglucosaminyldiphosphoundecaprenol N-acetyl-beta-D-mannosaminyltransferase
MRESISAICKRGFDLTICLVVLSFLSPILVTGYVFSGFSFNRTRRLGKLLDIFDELSFRTDKGLAGRILKWLHLARLPVWVNILKGDMSIVGPLPKSPQDFHDEAWSERWNVRPGLVSLWWIRRRANIDFETEFNADIEYIKTQSFMGDVGICLRAIPAMLYGDRRPITSNNVMILGIRINNLTMAEALDYIMESLNSDEPKQVCFVNADCVNIAYKDPSYLEVLQRSDLCLADGIGLKLAGKILGKEIAQNLCGTDMFPRLCERISGKDTRLFLLGARPEVVEGVVRWISDHYPKVKVCGHQHGYFLTNEESAMIRRIKDSRADLLLVAFGVPKQDSWISQHLQETGVNVAMGVGGLFDFYSGRIPRAPLWMREIGMEWLYRLIQEPGRMWKRYLIGNGLFLWRVLRERFRK